MFMECKKACIYTFAGSLLAEVEVLDGNKEAIELIIKEEDIWNISGETMIEFYDGKQGLVTCKCRISGMTKLVDQTAYRATCKVVKMVSENERRQALKVRIEQPVTIETSEDSGLITHIHAEIKDISLGGVGFESKESLNENQSFSFLINTNYGCVRLKGCVLWKQESIDDNEELFYRYGAQFLEMTPHQESIIKKFTLSERLKRQ
jgi:hypothetical protein